MVNFTLLLVSAVFFLAMSAVFYTLTWLIFTFFTQPRFGRPKHGVRNVLFFLLVLPPLVAGILTVGGVSLRHSHNPNQRHHSLYCSDIARLLAVPEGKIPVLAGLLIQGAAWLLLMWGSLSGIRLFAATSSLDRALRPFLKLPSPKLEAVLAPIRAGGAISSLQFFEAHIPPARSCLLGFRHVRCVLSTELVDAATDEELTAVVLHEINHYRTGDVGHTMLVGLLNCVFFYLRPLRLLSQHWREETELACDAATAAHTGNPLALASAILRAQGTPVRTNTLPTIVLGFAEEAACSPQKRVERLLSYAEQTVNPAMETLPVRRWQWTVTTGLTIMGIILLLTPQALCTAHCSLEAIARSLR